jgi:hypothetical protein
MTDSASLKVDRAAIHIHDLSELLKESRPFALAIQTNTKTRERTLFIKRNKASQNNIALIVGDAIHNLRSALDHTYWEIVSPHCKSDKERRRIQFPFTSKADLLQKTLSDMLAPRAGTGFYCAIRKLRPHGEEGGNQLLFLISELNNRDKHKLLIPTADYTKIAGQEINDAVPDCPILFANVGLSDNHFSWRSAQGLPPRATWGAAVAPSLHTFERILDIPVDVVLDIAELKLLYPLVPTLHQMVDAARQTITLLREGAASY